MKKILITGNSSYIGTSFCNWCMRYPEKYSLSFVDMRNRLWKEHSFANIDAVLHTAGIVHHKETKEQYERINRDLTYEAAVKAKADGVKQFIFLSTMSVYGMNSGVIDRNTPSAPKTHYGISKLQAEQLILPLQDHNYHIAVLRPPVVYGRNAKGNYARLSKIAKETPFFPDTSNIRSMLHIDNLCEFIRLLIDRNDSGMFFPQNQEYVSIPALVRLIAELHGHKMVSTKALNPFIKASEQYIGIVSKVFGSLVYEKSMSAYPIHYQIRNFYDSIVMTETVES